MNSPTNLNALLLEILLTPLVGAMMERGIKPAPVCANCEAPSTHELERVYLCRDCFEEMRDTQ